MIVAAHLDGCIRLRDPNAGARDAAATDVHATDITSADVTDDLSVSDTGVVTDTGVIVDTGVIADSGVIVDSGVLVDTGVLIDSGVPVDTGVVCPTLCGPSASHRNCGGACTTDLTVDPSNCGACGQRCASGERCMYGLCSRPDWVTTSEFATCAAIDGQAYCWGQNIAQSVAAGGANVTSPTPTAVAPGMGRTFMIAHGREATAALSVPSALEPRDLGDLYYWGSFNTINGASGETSATPRRLTSLIESYAHVSAGHSIAQFCARTADLRVFCWGRDDLGGLGREPLVAAGSFARDAAEVPALRGAVELAMGDRFGCARMCDGRVLCWGYNEDQQLGRSTGAMMFDPTPGPVELAGGAPLSDAIAVAAGHNHACAVRANGTVWCWGGDQCGQLGDGRTVMDDCSYGATGAMVPDSVVPRAVLGVGGVGELSGAVAVTLGQATSCAIVRRGTTGALYCWGANHWQQIRPLPMLGNWTTTPHEIQLGAGESVVQASAGYGHTCARLASGAVRCWGRPSFGQLGGPTGDAGATPFSATRDR